MLGCVGGYVRAGQHGKIKRATHVVRDEGELLPLLLGHGLGEVAQIEQVALRDLVRIGMGDCRLGQERDEIAVCKAG